jgi:hypothetical protein
METFKDIIGYKGLYQISDEGRVKSTPADGKKERILKQELTKSKNAHYCRVSLSKQGKVTRFLVHRLVATAFLPNPNDKSQVNHIDNNSENNDVSNLEWCTAKENMRHSVYQGRQNKSQEAATKQAAIINSAKAIDKYTKLINTSLNGRTLIHFYKNSKGKFKGSFTCDKCKETFEAGLDESVRKSLLSAPINCRSCASKARHDRDKDIV